MICGMGVDLTTVERFAKWVEKPQIINRYFNEQEKCSSKNITIQKEHYAARFAAKEAFGKALGTGISEFKLTDVFIQSEPNGNPVLKVQGTAQEALQKIYGECILHVSLSHEQNNAIAVVIIEKN